jgi:hypothetical protein
MLFGTSCQCKGCAHACIYAPRSRLLAAKQHVVCVVAKATWTSGEIILQSLMQVKASVRKRKNVWLALSGE